MTATGHAVIGTLIAAKISNPALAIPLAVASHVFADAFPHWDTGTNMKKKSHRRFFIESVVDVACSYALPALLTTIFFPSTSLFYVFLCVFSAQLLDWLAAPYNFLHWRFHPFDWLNFLQKPFDNRLDKPWGVIGQVAILVFLVFFALKV